MDHRFLTVNHASLCVRRDRSLLRGGANMLTCHSQNKLCQIQTLTDFTSVIWMALIVLLLILIPLALTLPLSPSVGLVGSSLGMTQEEQVHNTFICLLTTFLLQTLKTTENKSFVFARYLLQLCRCHHSCPGHPSQEMIYIFPKFKTVCEYIIPIKNWTLNVPWTVIAQHRTTSASVLFPHWNAYADSLGSWENRGSCSEGPEKPAEVLRHCGVINVPGVLIDSPCPWKRRQVSFYACWVEWQPGVIEVYALGRFATQWKCLAVTLNVERSDIMFPTSFRRLKRCLVLFGKEKFCLYIESWFKNGSHFMQ